MRQGERNRAGVSNDEGGCCFFDKREVRGTEMRQNDTIASVAMRDLSENNNKKTVTTRRLLLSRKDMQLCKAIGTNRWVGLYLGGYVDAP